MYAQNEQIPYDRRLSTIEVAVHALQQQQSGASVKDERIDQRITSALDNLCLQDRDINQVCTMYRGRAKILREGLVGCFDRGSIQSHLNILASTISDRLVHVC